MSIERTSNEELAAYSKIYQSAFNSFIDSKGINEMGRKFIKDSKWELSLELNNLRENPISLPENISKFISETYDNRRFFLESLSFGNCAVIFELSLRPEFSTDPNSRIGEDETNMQFHWSPDSTRVACWAFGPRSKKENTWLPRTALFNDVVDCETSLIGDLATILQNPPENQPFSLKFRQIVDYNLNHPIRNK